MTAPRKSAGRYRRSLRRTAGFVYRHSTWLVVISVCWVLASLPVVTSGIATLGAFSAIRSLRNDDRPRWDTVSESLRRHGFNVTVMSFVPMLLAVMTVLYAVQYVETGGIQYLLLSISGVYLATFLLLVSLTTVGRLSDGDGFVESVSAGYGWVVRNPMLSVSSALTMAGIVLVGVVSVVGLVIIVPAVVFSLHLEVTDDRTPSVRDDSRPVDVTFVAGNND
ncbi:hypothetical protein [Haladaptatus sp. DYF46]|uniref:hypothetical protein n=1 Tax=Haladaptatus sp. DYF46 TaxID=2886041 RepID=UPI001E4E53E6|nr:hypothetical protein [Haladaptatus sp. DYF46]